MEKKHPKVNVGLTQCHLWLTESKYRREKQNQEKEKRKREKEEKNENPFYPSLSAYVRAEDNETGCRSQLINVPPPYVPPPLAPPAPPQAVPLDPPGALDPLALNTNPFLGPFPSGAQYRNYHMQDNTVQMYPLIQVANPQAGVQGQDPTILVYRTWTPEDCKKACDDITLPQMDIELCIQDIRQLLRSYHTNGTETQQVLMCVNGKKWGTVRGDWVPVDPVTQQPWQPGSQELNDRLDRLYERMRTTFTRRADYSAITATRQKTDESFEDYSMRMKDVFRKNSGIPYAEEPEGPYQQQLKQAIHGGSKSEIKSWVERQLVDFGTSNLNRYEQHAMHAERQCQKSKNQSTGMFFNANPLPSRGRGRGRGRGGRGGGGNFSEKDQCHYCKNYGHWERDCRKKQRDQRYNRGQQQGSNPPQK
ncbi:uncharacterized protein LOC130526511 [Takifugu flavidus]|uniref:uncharacterized protein LOC130526511 n=1 Tax=Takifugu flavidus TaxID=433684 RepID=UPI00254440FF|nr:uncharacterized protein LOC130526511 [Takifugu flavidus]XP_056890252.1 uncharacterized protein LOC130526511 [Takifugu flavidus]